MEAFVFPLVLLLVSGLPSLLAIALMLLPLRRFTLPLVPWTALLIVVVLMPRYIPFTELKDSWSIKIMISALVACCIGCWFGGNRLVDL